MKTLESYKEILNNARFFSKVSTFLIAVFLLSEIFWSVNSYFSLTEEEFNSSASWVWKMILIGIGFKAVITIIFLSRFILLSFKKTKFILISQIVWFLGFVTILFFKFFTTKYLYGSFVKNDKFPCMDCFYYDTFLETSVFLTVILLAYLFLSPIKQIFIFLFALMSKEKTVKKSLYKVK